MGSEPSCLEDRDMGGDWRQMMQVAKAASSPMLAFSPLSLLPLEGLFLPETLLARECEEEPRRVTLLVTPFTADMTRKVT